MQLFLRRVWYWVSFLTELPVLQTSSHFHPVLKVSYVRGQYKLSTARAIYSFGIHYTAFREAFTHFHIGERTIEKVLVLGLGLGSIPQLLHYFGQYPRVTAVEIDPVVVELARRYLITDVLRSLHVVCSDAQAFIEQDPSQYDLICMDIFVDETVPQQFERNDFLYQLDHRLAPGGLLLYNRMMTNETIRQQSEQFYKTVFKRIFPGASCLRIEENLVLCYEKK